MNTLASAAVFSHGPQAQKGKHSYQKLPTTENQNKRDRRRDDDVGDETHAILARHFNGYKRREKRKFYIVILSVVGVLAFLYIAASGYGKPPPSCDTTRHGFSCRPEISHFWGQYSPYFEVPSEIPTEVPSDCQITFAQILSRHGARDPTLGKTIRYAELISRIQEKATSYSQDFSFLEKYNYSLGADQLTVFGQEQMIHSGKSFYKKYRDLSRRITPFIRASGQARVVESAQNWTQGFHSKRSKDKGSTAKEEYPYYILKIPESSTSNNTLDHSLCTNFESGAYSGIGEEAQQKFLSVFGPPILERINENIPGADLNTSDLISLMDLCPFSTVASPLGVVSEFCNLFTTEEWKDYDYYQSVGKYYGFSWGNPLGATQGIGYVNELIARLTTTAVEDHTSTNTTLDSNPKTFPLGGETVLYADFSHDNDMTSIFAALGLYNGTKPLLNTTREDYVETAGYSAAWSVPFAARAVFEKMVCVGEEEEFVRVVVNERVLPLKSCGGDELGRCGLGKFVESLSFAKAGGDWEKCFMK